jgi:hypothetical protein
MGRDDVLGADPSAGAFAAGSLPVGASSASAAAAPRTASATISRALDRRITAPGRTPGCSSRGWRCGSGCSRARDGDYFGAPLNRVARLLAAGHGGQTLLSAVAYDLCRDRLPANDIVRPLGLHGLKDLGRVETLYQVGDRDLPLAFPPLRTALAPLERASPSIAVLPFVNLSRDEENEFFAAAREDSQPARQDLTCVASRTSALRSKARTSTSGRLHAS